jgi:hypothetical protein
MPLEDILYQAYLLILSWPVRQEITGDGNSTAEADIDNTTEHYML